jgi:hypothetical protein
MTPNNPSKLRARNVVLGAAALVALTSCGALGSKATENDPAYLQLSGQSSTIVVRDTVQHGAAFSISFDTYGGGCTSQSGGDDISISGLTVEVRPLNRTVVTGNCGTDLLTITHTVTASILTAGTATIKIIGVTDQPVSGATSNAVTIQKTIIVQ